MAWTEVDFIEYDTFKKLRLFRHNTSNYMQFSAEVGLERVHHVSNGDYIQFSVEGNSAIYFAYSVVSEPHMEAYKIYKKNV
jgi:hypothetical protein